MSRSKATPKGFEPLWAEPNGFLVHLLSHSDKVSGAECCWILSTDRLLPAFWSACGRTAAHWRVSVLLSLRVQAAPNVPPVMWVAISHPPVRRGYLLRLGDASCIQSYNGSCSAFHPNFAIFCAWREHCYYSLAVTLLSCYILELLLSSYFTERFLCWTVTWLSFSSTLLYWAVTVLGCHLAEPLLCWAFLHF